mmetsp:Transcript_1462/g.2438  ORF Transcript_1462/g.2438 Transcript_1462/m.2438 type:complete len:206 (+) Transcript_1462:135-752(+)
MESVGFIPNGGFSSTKNRNKNSQISILGVDRHGQQLQPWQSLVQAFSAKTQSMGHQWNQWRMGLHEQVSQWTLSTEKQNKKRGANVVVGVSSKPISGGKTVVGKENHNGEIHATATRETQDNTEENAQLSPSTRRQVLSMFLANFIGFVLVAAKPKKGSKEDKAYQLCLSNCLYKCTVPRAGPAKERTECIRECKDECATTPEQL